MPPATHDLSGHLVGDRYLLNRIIGEGGFGRVYEADDQRLGVLVAVKIINPWWAQDDEWVDRFQQEARLTAKIGHPGVVRVTDTGVDEVAGPFIVAELVSGESLRSLLDQSPSLPLVQTANLVRQTADALAAAHERGVVHRDIKPSNLLVDTDGRVHVCDFGIAKLQAGATRSTSMNTIAGTPVYMAPEQAGGQRTGPAADQYALAVVLYEMLAGQVPFDGATPVEVAVAHLQGEVPPLPASVPLDLRETVYRGLEKDPASRFASISDFGEAVDHAAHGDPRTARTKVVGKPARDPVTARTRRAEPSAGTSSTASEPTRRRRGRWLVVALGVTVAGLAVAATQFANSDAGSPGASSQASAPQDVTTAYEPPPIPQVKVPTLTGISLSGARARAARRSISLDVTRAFSSITTEGIVARQHPKAGTKIDEGVVVKVTVSKGPPPVAVPDVVGSDSSQAQADLASAGLTSTVNAVPSSKPEGTVLRTDPAPGDDVPKGTTVELRVSRAKSWSTVGTYSLDSDGSTPSFRISGRQWRVTYRLKERSCEYDDIDCLTPRLQFNQTSGGYAFDTVNMSSGDHTIAGPDGPGSFQLTVRSSSGEWDVSLTVEQLS